MPKTSAFAVANYLLDQADAEGLKIRQLKLQKLVYFCYAWFAGNRHERLFAEDIEAWQYGPVVRDLYAAFKEYGRLPITGRATSYDWSTLDSVTPSIESVELRDDLKSVWDNYKRKSDSWLVEKTHAADEPWSILVRQVGGADKRSIPYELIESVYSKKVESIGA